jgi:hypothetical protein
MRRIMFNLALLLLVFVLLTSLGTPGATALTAPADSLGARQALARRDAGPNAGRSVLLLDPWRWPDTFFSPEIRGSVHVAPPEFRANDARK